MHVRRPVQRGLAIESFAFAAPKWRWKSGSWKRGMNGGSGVCFARRSASSWSSALKPAPMIAAPSDIVNGPSERPRYIGLPCSR